MGAKFLCCLPVRLGVLVISFCQFVINILAAGLLWWVLYHDRKGNAISRGQKISAVVFAIMYTIVALMSCVGFVGALTKKLRYISRFSWALNFVLGLQVFVGTAYLVLFFTDKSEFVDRCIAGSKDQDVINECNRQATSSKGVMIASVVIPPLIQLCNACYIVAAYAAQLDKEKKKVGQSVAMSDVRYQPASTYEDTLHVPLTQPSGTYPYTDAHNSYGGGHYGGGVNTV